MCLALLTLCAAGILGSSPVSSEEKQRDGDSGASQEKRMQPLFLFSAIALMSTLLVCTVYMTTSAETFGAYATVLKPEEGPEQEVDANTELSKPFIDDLLEGLDPLYERAIDTCFKEKVDVKAECIASARREYTGLAIPVSELRSQNVAIDKNIPDNQYYPIETEIYTAPSCPPSKCRAEIKQLLTEYRDIRVGLSLFGLFERALPEGYAAVNTSIPINVLKEAYLDTVADFASLLRNVDPPTADVMEVTRKYKIQTLNIKERLHKNGIPRDEYHSILNFLQNNGGLKELDTYFRDAGDSSSEQSEEVLLKLKDKMITGFLLFVQKFSVPPTKPLLP